jgi:hypothetical protein
MGVGVGFGFGVGRSVGFASRLDGAAAGGGAMAALAIAGSAKPAIARTAMSRAAVLAGFVDPIAGFERTMGPDRAPVGDPSVIPTDR